MKRLYMLVTIALLVAVTIVGCQLFDSPESAAKEVASAISTGDFGRLKGRICNAQSSGITDDAVQKAKEEFNKTNVKIDTSGLNFSAEVNGDTAFVTPSGKVKVETPQGSVEFNLDSAPIPSELKKIKMIREDGVWKLCPDGSLNLPGGF